MSEYLTIKATVPRSFMERLRREAPRFMANWGFTPGEDGQLLLAAAGAYLAIADCLAAVTLNDAVSDGMVALFGTN